MATPQTNDTVAAILKRGGYSDKLNESIIVRERPGLQLAKREKDFFSSEIHVPVVTGNNQNISADFAVAQAGSAGQAYDYFLVKPVRYYGVGNLDGLLVDQARMGGASDHFVDALKAEYEGTLESVGQRIAQQMYGNHGGALGRIASIDDDTLTLEAPSSGIYFSRRQRVAFSVTDGTSGTTKTGFSTVLGVDPMAGTVTLVAGGTATPAVGDYIFNLGDFGKAPSGFESWNPSTTDGLATPFWGMDRSGDPLRLAGGRYSGDAQGDTLDTVLQRGLRAHFAMTGQKAGYVLMNPFDVGKIEALKEATKEIRSDKTYNLGIEAFQVHGINVVEDIYCPEGIAQVVGGRDAWVWKTCGNVPRVDDTDGLKLLRAANGDNFELRIKGYHNFLSRNTAGLSKIFLPA